MHWTDEWVSTLRNVAISQLCSGLLALAALTRFIVPSVIWFSVLTLVSNNPLALPWGVSETMSDNRPSPRSTSISNTPGNAGLRTHRSVSPFSTVPRFPPTAPMPRLSSSSVTPTTWAKT